MVTNEIYFFKNQSSVSTSDFLYNVNDGTLILQVDGDVSNLELSVLGNTDLVDDDFVALKTINASDYGMCDKITSTGIYWIDINGIRKIKLNLSKITGSVSVKAITKRGLTTDLVARAMAANASGGGSYTLPVASASTLGGIKVGENLSIDENGVLSSTGGGGASIYKMFKYNNPEKALVLNDLKCGDILVSTGTLAYITFLNNNQTIIFNAEGTFLVSRVELIDGYAKYIKLFCIGGISYARNFNRVQEITIRDEQTRIVVEGATEYYDMYTMVKQDKNSNISGVLTFTTLPKSSVNPTDNNHFTRKGYVDSLPTTYAGYDATKTQVLKNINGVLTWQDE